MNILNYHLKRKIREWVKEVISLHTVVLVLSDLTYLKLFKPIQDKQLVFQPKETKKKRNTAELVFSQCSVNFYFMVNFDITLKLTSIQTSECATNCQLNIHTTFFSCQRSSCACRNTLAFHKMIFEATGLKTLTSQNYIFSDPFPKTERQDSPKLKDKT